MHPSPLLVTFLLGSAVTWEALCCTVTYLQHFVRRREYGQSATAGLFSLSCAIGAVQEERGHGMQCWRGEQCWGELRSCWSFIEMWECREKHCILCKTCSAQCWRKECGCTQRIAVLLSTSLCWWCWWSLGVGEGSAGIPISHEQRVAGEAFSFLAFLANLFQHLLGGLGSPCQFWWERTGEMLQLFTPGGDDADVALPAQRPGGPHSFAAPHIRRAPHGSAQCSATVVNHLKHSVQG